MMSIEIDNMDNQTVISDITDINTVNSFDIDIRINELRVKIETDLNKIATHIFSSKGPSGSNLEYLLNLCDALRSLLANIKSTTHYDGSDVGCEVTV